MVEFLDCSLWRHVLVVAARCAASVVDILARHPPPHRRLDRGHGAAAPQVRGIAQAAAFTFRT